MTAPLSQHGPAGEPLPGVGSGAGGFDKSGLLRSYAATFKCRTLVETGIYQGRGSGDWFPNYVAVDYQTSNCAAMRRSRPDARVLQGDSALVLRDLLGDEHELETPVLFWLDAHAISEEEDAPTICPVVGELEAIIGWEHAPSSVVLIDDLWGMGSHRGWPTLGELRELADRGPWNRVEQDGYMALTPRATPLPFRPGS